ncbi:MAG TPA: pyridoxal phosphate-dependent aminotransferase [Thermoplasmata archaeon]|nr:pyridoxal phosphate-dependent aminotransferase [Thermoplasmata archaeon]
MTEPPFDAFRYAHEHRTEVAWLSQNTNHLVPPDVVQPALIAAIRERVYEGYPLGTGQIGLKELVLGDLGLPPSTATIISAGATEALYMSIRALLHPGDVVLASDPSYLIIHKFIQLAGATTRELDIYAPPFKLTAERLAEAVTPQTRMILLIDPLNPLGSGYSRDEVRAIAEVAHDHRLLLLHDVTYRDFADHPTLAQGFYPERTLTAWSVSKNCGLAGLRLGGMVGPDDLIQQALRYNTNDLGVNVLAQVAAAAGLSTKSHWFPAVRATTRANQERIRSAISGLSGVTLPVFPSQANMFVIDIGATGVAPVDLQRELLLRHGVFVRAGNYLSPAHGGRFVRVSFSNPPADIARFVEAFPVALNTLHPGPTAPSVAAATRSA